MTPQSWLCNNTTTKLSQILNLNSQIYGVHDGLQTNYVN